MAVAVLELKIGIGEGMIPGPSSSCRTVSRGRVTDTRLGKDYKFRFKFF
jgi:hypothetical protein